MRCLVPAAALVIVALATAVPAAAIPPPGDGARPYRESFTDGEAQGWEVVAGSPGGTGTWSVHDGAYWVDDGSDSRSVYLPAAPWADARLGVRVLFRPSGWTLDEAEILFRIAFRPDGSSDAYRLMLVAPGSESEGVSYPNGSVGLLRYRGCAAYLAGWGPCDDVTTLASFDGPATRAGWNDVAVTLAGGRIEIRVNGIPVIDLTDPVPLGPGGIGLGTIWGVPAGFDSIRVKPLRGVRPGPTHP